MGRTKAKKPKKPRQIPLALGITAYDSDTLWSLITAAGAAPVLRRRWPTVGQLAFLAATNPPTGRRTAKAADLSSLLESATAQYPQISASEDFIPKDPRNEVRTRIGSRTYRLFSGLIERPLADVDRALLLAESIDEEIIAHHGFGIRDVVEICLAYTDYATDKLEATWPTGQSDPEVLGLTEEELDAAKVLLDSGTPSSLSDTAAKKQALEWLTCSSSELEYNIHHPQSAYGRFTRFRSPESDRVRWLPLAFIPEIMGFAVMELVESTPITDIMRCKFAESAADEARTHLWSFTDVLIGAPDTSSGPAVSPANVIQWAIPINETLVVLIQVVSSLESDFPQLSAEPRALNIARSLPSDRETRVPLVAGTITLPPGATAIPILVLAAPGHIMAPQSQGMLAMSLDDLRWIAATAENEMDLLNFSKDMSRHDRPRTMGFEAINYWEMWKSNAKSLFSGGRKPSFMSIAPHRGDAEWDRASNLRHLEVALATLNLPALRESVEVRASETDPYEVSTWAPGNKTTQISIGDKDHLAEGVHWRPNLISYSITLGPPPVAVLATDGRPIEAQDRRIVHDMAGSLAHGVLRTGTEWTKSHAGLNVKGHRVSLTPLHLAAPAKTALHASSVEIDSDDVVVSNVELDVDSFLNQADGDSRWIQAQFASAISEVMGRAGASSDTAHSLASTWLRSSPTMTLNLISAPTQLNYLESPIGIDEAFASTVDRTIAERVHELGIRPGLYEGLAAQAIDRDTLAPIALEHLMRQIDSFDTDSLVVYGMTQLQRVLENRNRYIRDLQQSSQVLDLSWDPIARANETSAEAVQLRRCNEIVVEASLRATPHGNAILDRSAWAMLLASANAYLDATMRSENVHYQVTPTAITIDEGFKISTTLARDDGDSEPTVRSYRIDKSFAHSLALDTFQADNSSRKVDSLDKSQVDRELSEAFGASASSIYSVLITLATWPQQRGREEVARVTRQDLLAWLIDNTDITESDDNVGVIQSALTLLVSTSGDLLSDPWRPWHARTRKRRLLIQPIPELPSGELVIAPHYLLASLSAYKNYLDQGMLPWSQPPAPTALDRALERFRDAKNRALELDIVDVLLGDGWKVISNVKENKARRLNVPSLATEIDAVAGKANCRTIYLIEAKDPVSVHATPQLRGQLDDFYREGGKKPPYAVQLDRKIADLAPHAADVAIALGLPAEEESGFYRIQALFVTRHPIVAGFVGERHPYATLKSLLSVVNDFGV